MKTFIVTYSSPSEPGVFSVQIRAESVKAACEYVWKHIHAMADIREVKEA